MMKFVSTFLSALALAIAATPVAASEEYEAGHTKGSADAPLTIIEYGSLSCAGCKYFHDEIMPRIESEYIDTGKVRFIFREVLRNDLDTALVSIARCAGEDNFFPAVDSIFDQQEAILAAARQGTALEAFITIGAPYGITDAASFNACYGDMNIRFDILAVEDSAEAYDLHGTPTLIVNGKEKYVDQDFSSADTFAAFLDHQLKAVSVPDN